RSTTTALGVDAPVGVTGLRTPQRDRPVALRNTLCDGYADVVFPVLQGPKRQFRDRCASWGIPKRVSPIAPHPSRLPVILASMVGRPPRLLALGALILLAMSGCSVEPEGEEETYMC